MSFNTWIAELDLFD